MDDFTLTANQPEDGWLVLTHNPTGITIDFERGRYNDTQHVRIPPSFSPSEANSQELARIMRGAGEWMAAHHYVTAMGQPNRIDLAAVCRRAIKERGLRQKDVAAAAGITPQALSHFLSGRQGLETARLERLLAALGLKVQ